VRGGTPAIIELQRAAIVFTVSEFEHDPGERGYGLAAATALGVDAERVFKTLLADVATSSGTFTPVVGIVPVTLQLSLKALAVAAGGKRAEMLAPVAAERITGYVVGGISPFGQKRRLVTVIDESCRQFATIFVSGGRRGLDIEISPDDLIAHLDAIVAPIATG
jgi:Cys-tRNA(Pro)/Cys-tRNA(Cys) deacylase